MLMELLQLAHIGGGGLLGGGQAHLLVPNGLLQLGHSGLGVGLGVLHQLVALALSLSHQVVRHLLSGHQGLAHGVLGGAVLLHLLHQHLHLGLQGGVFLVEGGVIRRQDIQKFVHHRHIISVKRLGKGVFRNFLRRKHSQFPLNLFVSCGSHGRDNTAHRA